MAIVCAAGAVVWRPGHGGTEIALVHRPKYDDWSFPKGKRDPGEHVLRTAVREVAEETGLRVVLGRSLSPSVYQAGPATKRVSYWAASCVESTGFVPGPETDQLAWLPVTAVRDRLSYQRDVELAEEFASGPARTVPFILLRHTSAGERSAAGAADLARPLDAHGVPDAELLAKLLACYERCRVLSSAAERCVATVRPYAAAAGVPVEIEPAFTIPAGHTMPGALTSAGAGRAAARHPADGHPEDGPPADGIGGLPAWRSPAAGPALEQAARRAAELAAAGAPTLICVHRENLPVMLEAACRALGAAPSASPALPKGGFLVLQSADGVLVSTEQQHLGE